MLAKLRKCLEEHNNSIPADLGLPLGGLVGTVDYEGQYHFGCYEDMLLHRPSTGEWWEVGSMLEHIQDAPWLAPAPQLNFQPQTPEATFCQRVQRAQAYIAAGDIYQVNLTHQFVSPWPLGADALGTYLRLREISPAPFAAFLDQGNATGVILFARVIFETNGRHRGDAPHQGHPTPLP